MSEAMDSLGAQLCAALAEVQQLTKELMLVEAERDELREALREAEREIQQAYREGRDEGYENGRDSCSDDFY